MDEKKRIIKFDAAEEVPVDGQIPIDSASQGTKKITPALLLKAITDLLGDEALDTLAQTLTGAVNEVKGIADDAQDLAENISDEYSSSSAYAKGDYCIHNNTLYKCTTAIGSGGEAWNASHWSATKCDDELSELKGTLDDTKHDILIKDNVKYIRGEFSIDNTTYNTYLKKIQKFISDIVTNGYDTKFDVLLLSDRRYDFSGSIYPAKDYGSGIFHNYQGVAMIWTRSNNVDTLYNITKTNA